MYAELDEYHINSWLHPYMYLQVIQINIIIIIIILPGFQSVLRRAIDYFSDLLNEYQVSL